MRPSVLAEKKTCVCGVMYGEREKHLHWECSAPVVEPAKVDPVVRDVLPMKAETLRVKKPRDREAYNKYMREYMAKKRASVKTGNDGTSSKKD